MSLWGRGRWIPALRFAAAGMTNTRAVRGLADLEPDPERQLKYLDFIDIHAALDENERIVYRQRYPKRWLR